MGMRKKVLALASVTVLATSLAACGKDYDAGNLNRHAETVSAEKDTPRNIDSIDVKDYAVNPTEIYTIKKPLYESEDEKIILEGYRANDVNNYFIFLKVTGNLTTADQGSLRLNVILENSDSFELRPSDRIEVIQSGNEEYHVYKSTTPMSAGKIVRVDTSLEDNMDGNFDEENAITTDIEDKREDTEIVPGIETIGTKNIPVDVTKENDDLKINIDSLDFVYEKITQVKINGSITFKKDIDRDIDFSFVEPAAQETDKTNLDLNNAGPYYEDTTADFTHKLKTTASLGKGNQLYFTIDGVLFALDLESGKELDVVDITKFQQHSKELITKETLNGFKDTKGKRVYDAFMIDKPFSYYQTGESYQTELSYSVNGYKNLTFDVGTEESGKDVPTSYDLYVYGDDFHMSNELSKPKGEILYHQKITNKTKMDTVDIKVKGQQNVTFYIDNNITSGGDNDVKENYLPVIFSNIILEK
ncbi:hypothetical protein CN918_32295 [Priestia megaterium]|nr:hypothetical protein CN918_32295 [Priestia megaterium]